MFKKLSHIISSSKQKGFTLIELLVVLGILGILAIALLAAINPIEQLNKAQDASLENAATTLINASVQYYSVNNALPVTCTGQTKTPLASGTPAVPIQCLKDLQTANELKSSYTNSTNIANIYVTTNAASNGLIACFLPKSTGLKNDPNTKYGQDGSTGGAYWCAQ